jgi:membrane-bound lytic murein transglycosylase D
MMKKSIYRWLVVVCTLALAGLAMARAVQAADNADAGSVSESSGADSADENDDNAPEEVMAEPTEEQPKSTPLNPKWTAPNFAGQEKALGWTPEAFDVPKGMEERVQFWKDIYTKYTSDQGILHDSKYVNLVYDSLDFADIGIRKDLNPRGQQKARRKRVEDAKKAVCARLKKLSSLKDGEGLEGEDARYWEMFSKVDEPKKFVEACKRGRIRFQLGQRDIFSKGIYFSGRYLRQMEEIFRQEGLPIELTRLPFVESSFNLRARSRVGASGIWQFMRSTARLYVRMDGSADERNDPLRATHAAARKLRENFTMLKSWPLAITAWNHGPAGVKRLTDKMGTTDIVELIDVRRGRFKFASASFFASFLAALDVERNADKNFGVLEVMPELRGAEIQLVKSQSSKDFMKWFNGDVELAKLLNPHVQDLVWKGRMPLAGKHYLRVPLTLESEARSELK